MRIPDRSADPSVRAIIDSLAVDSVDMDGWQGASFEYICTISKVVVNWILDNPAKLELDADVLAQKLAAMLCDRPCSHVYFYTRSCRSIAAWLLNNNLRIVLVLNPDLNKEKSDERL